MQIASGPPEWRQTDSLPAHTGGGWALWKGRAIGCDTVGDVLLGLKGWNPLQPVLVGEPGATRFVPPPCIAELKEVTQSFRRRTFFGTIALVIGSCIFLAFALATKARAPAPVYGITSMLAAAAGLDYFLNLRHVGALAERSRFFFWLQHSQPGRIGLLFWLAVGLAMGIVQFLLQRSFGSLDALVRAYGLMFAPAREGELWRIVVGPFFHSGVGHYLSNVFSLLFIGTLCWAILGRVTFVVFLVGTWISAAAQMYMGAADFDSFLGVSGGVFALYGLIVAAGVIDRRLLPKGLALLCVCVAIITGIGSAVLSSSAGSVSHVSGTIVGAVCAFIVLRSGRRSDPRRG